MNPRHCYISASIHPENVVNNSTSEDFEHRFYKECMETCPHIAIDVYHRKCENEKITNSCRAPKKYGLENSEEIIPKYYFSGKDLNGKLFECDFYYNILDSIRNMRILSRYQQQYIETLDKEDCYQLLREYNEVMESVKSCIMLGEDDTTIVN
jgi:hypothetical protein